MKYVILGFLVAWGGMIVLAACKAAARPMPRGRSGRVDQ